MAIPERMRPVKVTSKKNKRISTESQRDTCSH